MPQPATLSPEAQALESELDSFYATTSGGDNPAPAPAPAPAPLTAVPDVPAPPTETPTAPVTPPPAAPVTPPPPPESDIVHTDAEGNVVDAPPVPVVTAPIAGTSAAAAATAATDPNAAFWDEIDNDPRLSAEMRGKSRREVREMQLHATGEMKKSAMERNIAEERRVAAEAALAVIRSQQEMLTRATTPAPVAPAAPAPPKPGHQQFGLQNPEDSFAAVPQIVDQLPGFIDTRAAAIAAEQLRPIKEQLAAYEQAEAGRRQQAESDRVAAMYTEADRVFEVAQTKVGVDAATWKELKPNLSSYLFTYRDPTTGNPSPLDPRIESNWLWALNKHKAMAARLIPQVQNPAIPPPPAGNHAPSGTPPPAGGGARRIMSTGSKNMDRELRELASSYYPNDTAAQEKMYNDTVTQVRSDRQVGQER